MSPEALELIGGILEDIREIHDSRHSALMISLILMLWIAGLLACVLSLKHQHEELRKVTHAALSRLIPCEAKPASDQMYCEACQLNWPINDPHPPACKFGGIGAP